MTTKETQLTKTIQLAESIMERNEWSRTRLAKELDLGKWAITRILNRQQDAETTIAEKFVDRVRRLDSPFDLQGTHWQVHVSESDLAGQPVLVSARIRSLLHDIQRMRMTEQQKLDPTDSLRYLEEFAAKGLDVWEPLRAAYSVNVLLYIAEALESLRKEESPSRQPLLRQHELVCCLFQSGIDALPRGQEVRLSRDFAGNTVHARLHNYYGIARCYFGVALQKSDEIREGLEHILESLRLEQEKMDGCWTNAFTVVSWLLHSERPWVIEARGFAESTMKQMWDLQSRDAQAHTLAEEAFTRLEMTRRDELSTEAEQLWKTLRGDV